MINRDSLLPLKKDSRDYSLSGVFPVKIDTPKEFCIPNLEVRNQFNTDFCSAFATILASEIDEKVRLSEEYQFAKTKQVMGSFEPWGADLRSACKAITKYGSLEAIESPFNIDDDRNRIADWLNWDISCDQKALIHRKKSFFSVDGFTSRFDSIKNAIYKHNRVVITGAKWRQSWLNNKIIPEVYEDEGFGHAFCFKGFTEINGEEYLIAHLSNGEEIGDKGCFYFPRSVVERECEFGNFILVDMDPETAEYLSSYKITVDDNWLQHFMKIIKHHLGLD